MKRLWVCHSIALLLLLSWLVPPTAQLWQRIDEGLFLSLNGTLVDHPLWQKVAAFFCYRKLDYAFATFLATLTVNMLFQERWRGLIPRGIAFALAGLVMTLFVPLIHTVIHELIGFNRLSPSLTIEPKVWLSRLFDHGAKVRDQSPSSFPSDHALQFTFWTLFLWQYGGRRVGLPAAIFGLLFSIPRLISGAHWLTDQLVGSLSIGLILWGWLALLLQKASSAGRGMTSSPLEIGLE